MAYNGVTAYKESVNTMYAVEMLNYGEPTVLVDNLAAAMPMIKPKQVLVKQRATAIDPYDVKFRQGLMGTDKATPLIPGSSVAGVVVAVGAEVTAFAVGDRVAASTHLKSYAEFVPVGQSLLAKIPDAVSDVQAAAVVLGGQTGYQMITKDLAVQPSDTVLIQGGAGSVGFTAIQVAKWLGVQTLYTTVRGQAAAVVQAVDPTLQVIDPTLQVIDSQTTSLQATIPAGVDVILDTIGGDTLQTSLAVLKPTGRLVSLVDTMADPRVMMGYLQSNGTQLAELLALVAQGQVIVNIADTRPFNAANVRDFQTRQHVLGKLVLTFD